MKELSIEEKAKRYDEAIEKFDVILNLNTVKESGTIFADDVRKIFPELKESEDERMIQYFKDLAPFDKADELYEKYGFSHKDAIAWLERQAEHANFRSKIQIGDKVTRNEDGVLVNLSQLKRVAKKDDKQGEQTHKHFELKAGHWYICHRAFCCRADHLTVKEGERFMCEKDGVVKGFVIKEPEKYFKEVCAPAPMEGEQKPAWSEEDEAKLKSILFHIEDVENKDVIDWLKSLKERYTWKPSDGQMKAVKEAACYSSVFSEKTIDNLISLSKDLKKLKG